MITKKQHNKDICSLSLSSAVSVAYDLVASWDRGQSLGSVDHSWYSRNPFVWALFFSFFLTLDGCLDKPLLRLVLVSVQLTNPGISAL